MKHHHDDPGTPHLQPLRHFLGSFGALLLLRLEYRVRPVDGALDVPTGSVGARRPMPQDRFRIGAFEFEFFMACKAVEPLELRPNGLATTVMPLPRPPNFLRSLRLRCF